MHKIGYFVKVLYETVDDTVYFTEEDAEGCAECHLESLAEEAAKYAWDLHDGWEWLETGTQITLVADGKVLGDFRIAVDFDPTFFATGVED